MEEQEIISLSKMVFDDKEFATVEKYLKEEKYNLLRHLVSSKLEQIAIDVSNNEDSIITLEKCNRLEDVVLNLAIESSL